MTVCTCLTDWLNWPNWLSNYTVGQLKYAPEACIIGWDPWPGCPVDCGNYSHGWVPSLSNCLDLEPNHVNSFFQWTFDYVKCKEKFREENNINNNYYYNVKVWKTTQHKLHKTWCLVKHWKNSGKWKCPWPFMAIKIHLNTHGGVW